MSERMYRDEVGAAVERLEKLEEENAVLRAELERRKERAPRAQRAPSIGACALFTGAAFAMVVGLLAAHGGSGTHACSRSKRVHSLAAQRTYPSIDVRSRAESADCLIPYWFDENNVKRYKPQCLHGHP